MSSSCSASDSVPPSPNVPEKATKDGPRTWAPATPKRTRTELSAASISLAQPWPLRHVGSELAGVRSLSLPLSITLSFRLIDPLKKEKNLGTDLERLPGGKSHLHLHRYFKGSAWPSDTWRPSFPQVLKTCPLNCRETSSS